MSVARDPALAEALGHKPAVLAEAVGRGGEAMAGTRASLALRRDGVWRVFGWEDIERGTWDGETQVFRWWTVHEGESFEVVLEEEGRLPELFRERVEASTVGVFHFDLDHGGELHIVVRRPLDGSDALGFFALTSGGATLHDPRTRERAVSETDRIKAEYGVD